ncbi:PqqD family protein [Thalassobaculum sp.]|uniref:PqqD family protein n=1 Tax=Thalassobaculum sp. TaxID=2022740 RepID=UPI0032EA9A10
MTRLRRHPDALATELDGEAFLVRRDSDAILRLNPTATALWHALAEPATPEELAGLFAAAFPDVPADRLAADIDLALAALRAHGMVVDDPA